MQKKGLFAIKQPTIKTSFLDKESPTKKDKYRGLFKSSSGKVINADLNGSLHILKKGSIKRF